MTCTSYQEQISGMIDDELADRQKPELFFHLSECTECREFLQSCLRLRSSLVRARGMSVPSKIDERIERMSFGESASRHAGLGRRLWNTQIAFPIPVAASIALLLVVVSLIFSPLLVISGDEDVRTSQEALSSVPPQLRPAIQILSGQQVPERK